MMNLDELTEILRLHKLWLAGKEGKRADLEGADLEGANLRWAYLERAYLEGAYLQRANLRGANLRGANLSMAQYAVSAILCINWGQLSSVLTLELMRHDAESCGIEAMNAWAEGGQCPFIAMQRDYVFQEVKQLWQPGSPQLRGIELLQVLAREKKITL